MRKRNFRREFRLNPKTGKIYLGISLVALVIAALTGWQKAVFAPREFNVAYVLSLLLTFGFVALGLYGVWVLVDRRPRVVTDEHGITDRRQSVRPLSLGWNEIGAISLFNEAFLRLVTLTEDGEVTHQIWLFGLDSPGSEIFDHVLKCHAAHGPQVSAVVAPQPLPSETNEAEKPRSRTTPADAEEMPEIGTQSFHGRKLFRPDLRIIGGILCVFAFGGIISSCAGDGGNEFGKLTSNWAVLLTVVSVFAGLTGGVLIATTVRDHGWSALPRDGWPQLHFDDEALTFERDEDEVIRVPWDRMRKIVPITVSYNNGPPQLLGYTVYFATKKEKISSFVVNVYAYVEPDAVIAAFSSLSFTRKAAEPEGNEKQTKRRKPDTEDENDVGDNDEKPQRPRRW